MKCGKSVDIKTCIMQTSTQLLKVHDMMICTCMGMYMYMYSVCAIQGTYIYVGISSFTFRIPAQMDQ